MRLIIIFILLSFNVFAQEEIKLAYQVSQNQEINQLVFFIRPTEIKRWQNSNYFSDLTDVKLGEMRLEKNDQNKKIYDRMKAILNHYTEIDAKLKKMNKSWNDTLEKSGPHSTIVWLNKFKIPSDSYYAKEIESLMSALINQKSNLIEGIELVSTNKKINYVKDSKVTKTEGFLQPFYCQQKSEKTQLCHVKKWGSLSIGI